GLGALSMGTASPPLDHPPYSNTTLYQVSRDSRTSTDGHTFTHGQAPHTHAHMCRQAVIIPPPIHPHHHTQTHRHTHTRPLPHTHTLTHTPPAYPGRGWPPPDQRGPAGYRGGAQERVDQLGGPGLRAVPHCLHPPGVHRAAQ